jgi:hypothetical protein
MIDAAETAVHGLRASRTFSPPGILPGGVAQTLLSVQRGLYSQRPAGH